MLKYIKTLVHSPLFRIVCISLLIGSFFLIKSSHIRLEHNISLFDELNNFSSQKMALLPKKERKIYLEHKRVFEKNYRNDISQANKKIPYVIHWIWVGPNPFPEVSIPKVESWIKLHPEWTIKFWTDNPNRKPPHPQMETHLIDEIDLGPLSPLYAISDNPGEKSDILRCLILEKEGGLYVDHDVICFESFEKLHHNYNLFCCLEKINKNPIHKAYVFPCNCIIGASPHHPVMKASLKNIVTKWESCRNRDAFKNDNYAKVISTTFASFYLAVREHSNENQNIDIVLPGLFFFPTTITENLKDLYRFKKEGYILCNHGFDGTWL